MLLTVYSSTATTALLPLLWLLLLLLLLHPPSLSATRHLLHHPFFPSPSSTPLSPSEPPASSPHHHHHSNPKLPSSSSPPSTTTTTPPPPPTSSADTGDGLPFFPSVPPTPPPPPPPPSPTATPTTIPTFPANISSLALPSTSSSSHPNLSGKLVVVAIVAVSLVAFSLITFLTVVLIRRKSRRNSAELRPLYPQNAPTSDGRPPPKLANTHVSQTSSEFLYLGTISESCEFKPPNSGRVVENTCSSNALSDEETVYHIKLCGPGSPELKPLPPLPRHTSSFQLNSAEQQKFREEEEGGVSEVRGEDEEFFSPSGSSCRVFGEEDLDYLENLGIKSYLSSSYHGSPGRDSDVSSEIQTLAEKAEFIPAPPPPPARSGVSSGSGSGPPPLVPPSGLKRSGALSESGEESMKPKLKALYWDKVRASSDRVMVWDQLKPGSFKLNEEMIETLFKANNGTSTATKDGVRRSILPLLSEEYRVLDPKKSQNIAILLKALSVTEKEVCDALLEGNSDTLGTELLESLLKMAPTKEEEMKLLEYKDESPLKLGPAEKFLRAVLGVPFAFKRVDAMLYMATFDSEVEYLRKSFETLEAACEQLKGSRMFLKLLEAVLKTGNRMNVGTNRGDALAFKLDTLLKLVDIKGTDGKTTLLHFVVQEIIKAEGCRLSQTNQPDVQDDIESRKRGLEDVASLGGELTNVKKAAAMDSDSLSMDVSKLARGMIKINEVLHLNESTRTPGTNNRFSDSMNQFLKKAETEIVRIQSQESSAFSRVRDLTIYFHGDYAREEAHPLRIFTVVRDFLGVLDQVCKEVGKINERTIISSVRPLSTAVNQTVPPPFPQFSATGGDSSSDDENFTLK